LGKTPFLLELIRRDGLFLMGREFYTSADARRPREGKQTIKALVVACNTADAYGRGDLESLVATAGSNVPVIGVIDAAVREAMESAKRHGGGTIGVLATEGTVATGAYPVAVRRLAAKLAIAGPIEVVQQGSLGLAGAIDGTREFIVQPRETGGPRPDYRGPSLSNPRVRIDPRLLPRYHFDFSEQRMLCAGDHGNPEVLQINSVENYIRYDLVTLLESVGRAPKAGPLRAIILGCTHFPHYSGAIAAELRRLFDYQEQGRYVYRDSIDANVTIIDPAMAIGEELYSALAGSQKLAGAMTLLPGETRGEFYITVPYRGDPRVTLDPHGWFTYEYKYGRDTDRAGADMRTVPLLPRYLDSQTAERLSHNIPGVWSLLEDFLSHNAKLSEPKPDH
jgi:glutamate racemase